MEEAYEPTNFNLWAFFDYLDRHILTETFMRGSSYLSLYNHESGYHLARMQRVNVYGIQLTLGFEGGITKIVRKMGSSGYQIIIRGQIKQGEQIYELEKDTFFDNLPESLKGELNRTIKVIEDEIGKSEENVD